MTKGTENILKALSNQMADAVEKVSPAIVKVNGRQRQPASGIVFGDNLVLTADHVLEREEDITIETADKRTLSAQFVGRDVSTDLAVLRVEGLNTTAASVAASAGRVGEYVLLVGRPSSESLMASGGIISAVGGPLKIGQQVNLEKYIQTDATPYPGFSGGALIDAEGAVIGLTTTGLARGVTLVVPASVAMNIANNIAQHGTVKRGFLGIGSQLVDIPPAQRAGREQAQGLLLVKVETDSPAAQGGLLVGDILLALDGKNVTSTEELQGLLSGDRVGKAVPVEVIRGGALQTVQVTIGTKK